MTVKTLTYIHKLLIEEVSKLDSRKILLANSLYVAQDNDADNVDDLKEAYWEAERLFNAAQSALNEFAGKEW